ncbi:protein LYRIC-like [Festucalex cinctus]
MEQWRDAASQQAEVLASRVNALLSKGQEFLRTELGVDLAIKPELIPPWVILLATCTGFVLMLVVWASMCQALFKKRPTITVVEDTVEVKRSASKPVKSEEPKKRRKRAEKKAQPNGRAVTEEVQEEDAIVSEARVPHQQPPPPQSKNEKAAETKKSKKKAKQAVKETVTAVGKEPEEGTWETKVSNKEKREQRKKDKSSSDGSASPGGGGGGGGGTPVSATPEQRKASAATPPANHKKKKGESSKVTAEKVNAVVSQVNKSEAPSVAAGVADSQAVKVPHTVAPKTQGPWTATREAAPLWKTDIDDSWTVIDRVPSDLVSFTKLGVGTAEPQLVDNVPWLSQPKVDDEWSGFNGGSADPSSDWNAPSEVWGNYEEPPPQPTPVQEQPRSEPAKANLLSGAAEEDDEDDKDNGETAADGAAKNKKRRKKKKKAAEEGETSQAEVPEKKVEPPTLLKDEKKKKKPKQQQQPPAQEHSAAAVAVEVQSERPVKDSTSAKPLATQVPLKQPEGQATALANFPAPTQQQKPEESQAAKLSKKKKARRET